MGHGSFSYTELVHRCGQDCGHDGYELVFTHCDQLAPPSGVVPDLYFDGPTAAHAQTVILV